MRGSLVSREIIADSVECVMHSERLDALVTFAGCDKSLPGMLMAAARLNLPSVFLYGGSILPGHYKDQALDIVSVFEAVGACAAGTITENELGEIETAGVPDRGLVRGHVHREHHGVDRARRSAWRCPGSSAPPAVDRRRDDFAYEIGRRGHAPARARPPAPSDHDQGGVRERDRGHDGARRFHQRGAAPPRDRARGRTSSSSSTTSTASARAFRTSPT